MCHGPDRGQLVHFIHNFVCKLLRGVMMQDAPKE
jgi:hypothetical protein